VRGANDVGAIVAISRSQVYNQVSAGTDVVSTSLDSAHGRIGAMAVARVTEIRASSRDGFQEAVLEGLERARKTLRNITGIELTSKRVKVEAGRLVEYRVDMKIIFVLE